MRKTFAAVFCLFLFFAGHAQNKKIDSLRNETVHQTNDTNRLKAIISLGWQYYLVSKYDSTLACEARAMVFADKLISRSDAKTIRVAKQQKARAYMNQGNANYITGQYPAAIDSYKAALAINQEIDFKSGITKNYSGLGNTYVRLGDIPTALKYFYDGLKIHEALKDSIGIAAAYTNIGIAYNNQAKYDEALKSYQFSLNIDSTKNNKFGMAGTHTNMGVAFEKLFKYQNALDQYAIALKLYEELQYGTGLATCYNNIGVIYGIQGNQEEALKYHFKSLEMKKATGDQPGVATSYVNIGAAYLKLNKTKQAIAEMDTALAMSKAIQSNELIMMTYQALSEAYAQNKQYDSAFATHKEFSFYRDKVINDANTATTLQTKMTYDFEKKEIAAKEEQTRKEAVAKEAQARKDAVQRIITWSVIGGIVLFFLLVLLFVNRIRLRQKNRYQQQLNTQQKEQAVAVMDTQEQERKRIAEDLHDSLGHLLSTVKFNLQTLPDDRRPQVESSMHLLNQATEELRNITFNLMPRTLEEGGLIPALNELASKITSAGRVHVSLHVHNMERFVLEKQSQFNIYRIVQEAVNNILKHADAKEIGIQLIGQENHITIMIEDDGKGFNPGEQKSGRGLKNIVTRSLWLKGNINIDSHPGRGTTITTEIPV